MKLRRLVEHLRGDRSCREFCEAVTEYFEGVMASRERARFARHLQMCKGCERYLDQIRVTVELTGKLRTHDVDALPLEARDALLGAFRNFRDER